MKRALAVLCALVGCGDNMHPPRVRMAIGKAAPAYGETPFPTDAMREGAKLGTIQGLDSIIKLERSADLVAAHLSRLDGFGLRPTIEFFVQGALDPDTIPETTNALTDAVFVLDADPDTGEMGAPIPFDWRYDPERGVIAGSPAMGTQLREGTTYAAVLTTGVKNPAGDSVFSGVDLGLLEASDLPDRWKSTGVAYKELKALPALKDRMVGLAVFTTQYASNALVKARNVIANTAAVATPTLAFPDASIVFDTPAKLTALLGSAARNLGGPRKDLEQWGSDNATGIAHDHIAVVATGTTTVAQFVGPDDGTDGPDDETFALGVDGVPQVRSTQTIPISIVLPKGPVPAAGFPVVIYGHGLGGSRHDMLAVAEPLAAQGYAVVAIDMWGFGSRYNATDTGNNLASPSKPDFTGTATLRDGFGDDVGASSYFDFFEGFMNLSAIRDSIRQSALDNARVAMLVRTNPNLAALAAPYGATPKLDPSRVAYLGVSFGTLVGTALAAIEPSVGLYVLDVPGGGLVDYIVPNSAGLGELALPFAQQLYRTTGTLDRFHPLVGMLQTIFDGGDSLTYGRHVLRDRFMVENNYLGKRHVVMIEAMNDEVMPNVSTEALARAFGVYVLKPAASVPAGMLQVVSPGSNNVAAQTGILVQYEPATHGNNWSAEKGTMSYKPGYPYVGDVPFPKLDTPIEIREPLYETWDQVTEILSSYFAGQSPMVRSTKAPIEDFDDDGRLDPVDPDPYDPTR